MSLRFSFMVLFSNDSDILVEAEDRAGEQERLRHIVEQPARHVVDLDHLIRHERDTAHDEQHRTGVLRDFEAFLVFHGLTSYIIHLPSYIMTASPAAPRMAAMT